MKPSTSAAPLPPAGSPVAPAAAHRLAAARAVVRVIPGARRTRGGDQYSVRRNDPPNATHPSGGHWPSNEVLTAVEASAALAAVAIPPLTAFGLLPPGVHDATLEEVEHTFASNERRVELFHNLKRLLDVVERFGFFQGIVLDGSFVTDKEIPEDIDAVLLLQREDLVRLHRRPDRRLLVDDEAVKAKYNVHLFFDQSDRLSAGSSWTSAFQCLRPAEGLLRKLTPDTRRGLLKISL